MKKEFKIIHTLTDWQCIISIDPEFVLNHGILTTTNDAVKSMVEFWTDWKQRLNINDGDYIQTFAQQLGREIFYIKAANNTSIPGIIDEFKNREGWSPMDGSFGINIVSVDYLYFEHYEFQVEEWS